MLTEQQMTTIRAVADRLTDSNYDQAAYGEAITGNPQQCGTAHCVAGHTVEYLAEQGRMPHRERRLACHLIDAALGALGLSSERMFAPVPPVTLRRDRNSERFSYQDPMYVPPTAEEMRKYLYDAAGEGRWPPEANGTY